MFTLTEWDLNFPAKLKRMKRCTTQTWPTDIRPSIQIQSWSEVNKRPALAELFGWNWKLWRYWSLFERVATIFLMKSHIKSHLEFARSHVKINFLKWPFKSQALNESNWKHTHSHTHSQYAISDKNYIQCGCKCFFFFAVNEKNDINILEKLLFSVEPKRRKIYFNVLNCNRNKCGGVNCFSRQCVSS